MEKLDVTMLETLKADLSGVSADYMGKRLIEQDVKLKYIPFRPAKPFIKCIRYFSSKFLVR